MQAIPLPKNGERIKNNVLYKHVASNGTEVFVELMNFSTQVADDFNRELARASKKGGTASA